MSGVDPNTGDSTGSDTSSDIDTGSGTGSENDAEVGVSPGVVDLADVRRLMAIAPCAMSLVDVSGQQVAWNDAYRRLLGYSDSELSHLDVGALTREADRAWTRAYVTQLGAGALRSFETDKVLIRKDGSEVRARLAVHPVTDAVGRHHLLGAIVALEESERSSTHLEQLTRFSKDHVFVIDQRGRIVPAPGDDEDFLGYPREYWSYRHLRDVVDGDDREIIEGAVRDFDSSSAPSIQLAVGVRDSSGERRTLDVTLHDLRSDPAYDGFVAVVRDVTELEDLIGELTARRSEAEAGAEAQRRLLATVSHELRNPLHALQGIAELLLGCELPVDATDLAGTLLRQLQSLGTITQDLLDAAREDAAHAAPDVESTNVHELFRDVVTIASAMVQSAVELRLDLDVSVPPVIHTDQRRLRQVVSNLVGNAAKFTTAGTITVLVEAHDQELKIAVRDTGCGIPADELDMVLEPFRTGSTAGADRGAGLGLAVVHRLVASLGGTVRVASRVGEGSTFTVAVPYGGVEEAELTAQHPGRAAVTSGSASSTAAPSDAAADVLRYRVLVVEDNLVNQQLAERQLQRLGHECTVVESGEQALALLADRPSDFDVILMDQQLPGRSGVETVMEIRRRGGPAADIPAIGVTASASERERAAFIDGGLSGFVSKPATLGDLSAAITDVMSGSRPVAPSPDPAEQPISTDSAAVAAPAPSGIEPVHRAIDREVFDVLVDDLGTDSVSRLVEAYVGNLEERVAAIVNAETAVAAGRAAHALRSTSALLGATKLAETCRAIEYDAAPGTDVPALAVSVRRELQSWAGGLDTGVPRAATVGSEVRS